MLYGLKTSVLSIVCVLGSDFGVGVCAPCPWRPAGDTGDQLSVSSLGARATFLRAVHDLGRAGFSWRGGQAPRLEGGCFHLERQRPEATRPMAARCLGGGVHTGATTDRRDPLDRGGAAVTGVSGATVRRGIRAGEITDHYSTREPLIMADESRAGVESAPIDRHWG